MACCGGEYSNKKFSFNVKDTRYLTNPNKDLRSKARTNKMLVMEAWKSLKLNSPSFTVVI